MLDLLVRRGAGTEVTFKDATGAEHIVILSSEVPEDEAPLVAQQKLEAWASEGRAMYAEPLELAAVIRRR